MGKRLLDIFVAIVGLVILAPVLLLVACAVRLSGPGPVIYRGMRIGRYGKPFYMLKFRTMRPADSGGAAVTAQDDPRVTRIGHLLRITKVDELLQLVNVLRGEMSLVGPRPHSYQFITYFSSGTASEILSVRPGITGLVQLQFRREELQTVGNIEGYYVNVVLPYKQQIDLTYVHHHPFWRDLQILLMTGVVLFRPLPPPVIPIPEHLVMAEEARELAPVLAQDVANAGALRQSNAAS